MRSRENLPSDDLFIFMLANFRRAEHSIYMMNTTNASRLASSFSLDAATKLIARLLLDAAPRGAKPSDMQRLRDAVESGDLGFGSSLSLEVERAWGAHANLSVGLDRETVEADDGSRWDVFAVSCQLSWSATGRTVAASVAAIAVYQELTALAAEVEARMASERIAEIRRPAPNAVQRLGHAMAFLCQVFPAPATPAKRIAKKGAR